VIYLPWLGAVALVAAAVNGALGYGFSSLTVPIALLALPNRVLNPALVLVEVGLNAYVLFVNRAAAPRVWTRVRPVVAGLLPGIAVGTAIVSYVDPAWLKLATFAVLLPLILIQAAGVRRPIRAERGAGAIAGTGVGVLYAVTTISGPPLAVMLNNQGFAKTDFRAALGIIRLVESSLTALAYFWAGLMTPASLALLPTLLPSLVIGVPLGAWLLRRLEAETFRRICMSFDAWVVAFGLATPLRALQLATAGESAVVMIAVVALDLWLLAQFFARRARRERTGVV
jgi:uncharacterized membrane protein YfcA